MEVFIAVCARMGIETGVDVFAISDVAEDIVVPMMDHIIRIDRDALTLGYAWRVFPRFVVCQTCRSQICIKARDLLVELGRRGTVWARRHD